MLCSPFLSAQDTTSTFDLELLSIGHPDRADKRKVGALFVVKPKGLRHFPPVLSMGISYAVNGDTMLQRIDIQNDPLHRAQIEILDKNIADKKPRLYAAVKHKIHMDAYPDLLFLVFRFQNISDVDVNSLELVYGLWEKEDLKKRVERHYRAVVGE